MDGYFLILCLGFGCLLLMSLLGLSHHQAHRPAHGTTPVGHHHAGGIKGLSCKTKAGHAERSSRSSGLLLALISPRVLSSLMLGFGATGTLLRPWAVNWPALLLPSLAAVGAWAFEWYAVQPLWRLLFGFASCSAQTLESIVLEEGKAVTNFDATGHGLIVVDLDGQVRQLLGSLAPEDLADHAASRVRAGERLFIRAVDPRRNSCTVSRLN